VATDAERPALVPPGPAPQPPAAAPAFVVEHYLDDLAGCRFHTREAPPGHICDLDFLCRRRQDYRRIDDMLEVEQSSLALKMDNNTNNTSLVLAFDLSPGGDEGPVLLFAADAQVGNWQSWENVKYSDKRTGEKKDVTTAQLLARAQLYKVGHHGSHNATLKAKGLEMMTHPKLVALIPTVEDIALRQGRKGWQMPNPETYKGLIRQTNGRILRGDFARQATARQPEGLRDSIERLVGTENQRIRAEHTNEKEIVFDAEFAPAAENDLYVDLVFEC
jgi:hypothetical protein